MRSMMGEREESQIRLLCCSKSMHCNEFAFSRELPVVAMHLATFSVFWMSPFCVEGFEVLPRQDAARGVQIVELVQAADFRILPACRSPEAPSQRQTARHIPRGRPSFRTTSRYFLA